MEKETEKEKNMIFKTGKLLYEGEYLDGERPGKGKEYDFKKGNLI